MSRSKMTAYGLCGLGFFGTFLCMLLSAAGLRSETRVVFLITLGVLALGFVFGRIAADGDAVPQAEKTPQARALVAQAVAALEAMDQNETPETRADFQQKAACALMALGDVRITRQDLAVVAASKAIEAQHALRAACEQGEPPEQVARIRQRAGDLAVVAIHEFRRIY